MSKKVEAGGSGSHVDIITKEVWPRRGGYGTVHRVCPAAEDEWDAPAGGSGIEGCQPGLRG